MFFCTSGAVAAGAVDGTTGPVGVAAVAGGVSVATVISAISKKGIVLDAVKRIIELLSQKTPGYANRYQNMQDAYALLCVASFFDAYSSTIPKDILSKIQISSSEQAELVPTIDIPKELSESREEPSICLPHIVYGCEKVYTMLSELYSQMTERLKTFISNLSFIEESDEKTQQTIAQKLNELPDIAICFFKDQYLTLCSRFNDFYAYVSLEKECEYKNEADKQNKKLVEMILHSEKRINQSFEAFEEAIKSIPAIHREQEAQDITLHIKEKYIKAVERTIVSNDDDENLTYPSVENAFIPQRYRLLEYNSKDTRLEIETEWDKYDERNDMLSYWAKYILDPQSTEHIFLVLGDPGGGKSLLMEMVSARLSSDAELVIKIPLRHYTNMGELDIETMICKQIMEDGDPNESIQTFKHLTGDMPERPFTLIFDGYDEVQQATGMAFRLFLTKLKKYQDHCKDEKRPVRVIVTSRRTLIDKADIPLGTTVMKLLDFDDDQKDKWTKTWNDCNHENLQKKGIKDFSLPKGNHEIDELSGQPLLLLMLAIYDADFERNENALQRKAERKRTTKLNRMRLYDELIRRFIRRELLKGKRGEEISYEEADDTRREKLINTEMNKLGIAAFGMFIREKLNITIPELKADITRYKAEALSYSSEGSLDAHEVFFGSFFFIHDSRTEGEKKDETCTIKELEKEASFVFLHKTFYEFLTADFVLSCLFKYVVDLAELKNFKLRTYESKIVAFDDEFPQFYLTVSGSPLCSEPEIIKMIEEWGQQKLAFLIKDKSVTAKNVEDVIGNVLESHVNLLKKGNMTLTSDWSLLPDRYIPQQNSIYIINLITLRTLINGEWRINSEIWQYIAQYVKLNTPHFKENDQRVPLRHHGMDTSEELPLRFMALFSIVSEENFVTIKRRKVSVFRDDRTPLDAKLEVFAFLQDRISQSVYSLHSSKTQIKEKKTSLNTIISFDQTVIIDAEIAKLQDVLLDNVIYYSSSDVFYQFVRCLDHGLSDISRIVTWLVLYRQLIHKHKLIDDYLRIREYAVYGTRNLFRLIKEDLSYISNDYSAILNLWVEILIELKLNTIIIDILEYAFHSYRIDSIKSKDWLFDVIRAIPCGYGNNFNRNSVFNLHYTRYDYEDLYKYIIKVINSSILYLSPKVLAALLEAERKLGSEDYELNQNLDYKEIIESLLNRYSNASMHMNQYNLWRELPFILRELVIRGENEHVAFFLNNFELSSDMIIDSIIMDYVAIADTVFAKDFLEKTVETINTKSYSRLPSYTIAAVFRASYSLLYHTKKNAFSTIKFLLNDKELLSSGIMYAPTEAAKLLSLILRRYDRRFPDSLRYIVLQLLKQFETILQQSPTTALELLSLSSREINLNPSVVNCYCRIAYLEGYSELIEHYFKLS